MQFFAWANRNGYAIGNPVRDVKVDKPVRRSRYITDAEYHAIHAALAVGADGRRTPSGRTVQAYVDLCYLLFQRTTDIRPLRWSEIDLEAGTIRVRPTRTERSSGLQVTLRITPAIRGVLEALRPKGTVCSMYVIRTIDNQPYSASGLRTAWSRACERAGLKGMTLKDLRAKAATDARLAGYQPEQIQVALAHTDRSITEHYILGRDAPLSEVQLKLPERPKEGGASNEGG